MAHSAKCGRLKFGGWINAVIPILIVPYYSVIGGWVIRYLSAYVSGHGSELAQDGYFSGFISSGLSAEVCFLIFTIFTLVIIFAGVRNGVERVSKLMMPVLVVLSVIIAVYSVTRPGALAGVKYFLVPNVAKFFLDDRRHRHGADVLLAVHCHGHSRDLWFLHERGCFH